MSLLVGVKAKDFASQARDQVRSYFPHWSVRAETRLDQPLRS